MGGRHPKSKNLAESGREPLLSEDKLKKEKMEDGGMDNELTEGLSVLPPEDKKISNTCLRKCANFPTDSYLDHVFNTEDELYTIKNRLDSIRNHVQNTELSIKEVVDLIKEKNKSTPTDKSFPGFASQNGWKPKSAPHVWPVQRGANKSY